jgi:Ca2+-binding EF-hand superfamily protein
MGNGVVKSTDFEQAFKSLEEIYKENPQETMQSVSKYYSRLMALEYARKKACFTVPPNAEIEESFALLDYNNNNIISLAEIDKFIVERYPQYNKKPVLIRAYKSADADNDGFITKKEYELLFQYIYEYDQLWEKFESIDKNNDRRISKEEFKKYASNIFSETVDDALFDTLDQNNGGYILFYEFVHYFVSNKLKR